MDPDPQHYSQQSGFHFLSKSKNKISVIFAKSSNFLHYRYREFFPMRNSLFFRRRRRRKNVSGAGSRLSRGSGPPSAGVRGAARPPPPAPASASCSKRRSSWPTFRASRGSSRNRKRWRSEPTGRPTMAARIEWAVPWAAVLWEVPWVDPWEDPWAGLIITAAEAPWTSHRISAVFSTAAAAVKISWDMAAAAAAVETSWDMAATLGSNTAVVLLPNSGEASITRRRISAGIRRQWRTTRQGRPEVDPYSGTGFFQCWGSVTLFGMDPDSRICTSDERIWMWLRDAHKDPEAHKATNIRMRIRITGKKS